MRRLCCSRALHTVQQREPLVRTSATRCSAAWSMAPAGYNLLPLQNRRWGQERPSNRTAKPKQKHKRIKRSTKPPTKREKREEITVAVCVYCWGRQSSAILSHLSLNGLSHKTKIEKTWLTGRIQQYRWSCPVSGQTHKYSDQLGP